MRHACLLLTIAFSVTAVASADTGEFVHEANVMARLGNHPNVVQFLTDAPFVATAELATDAIGGTSPLYESQTKQVSNPLYETGADPGSVGSFESIQFTLDNVGLAPSLHREGVVHRDIAARNFIVSTNFGVYESAPGAVMLFGSDGPGDLSRADVGPIRWMAPESLRLHATNPTSDDDWIDIEAGSFFVVDYATPIPEPTSAALLALAGVAILRRRGG